MVEYYYYKASTTGTTTGTTGTTTMGRSTDARNHAYFCLCCPINIDEFTVPNKMSTNAAVFLRTFEVTATGIAINGLSLPTKVCFQHIYNI